MPFDNTFILSGSITTAYLRYGTGQLSKSAALAPWPLIDGETKSK